MDLFILCPLHMICLRSLIFILVLLCIVIFLYLLLGIAHVTEGIQFCKNFFLTLFIKLLVACLYCPANVGTGRLYCALQTIQHMLEGISHKHIYKYICTEHII